MNKFILNKMKKIKLKYIIQLTFSFLKKYRFLSMINYNKLIQSQSDIEYNILDKKIITGEYNKGLYWNRNFYLNINLIKTGQLIDGYTFFYLILKFPKIFSCKN